MIEVKHTGSFRRTERFLDKLSKKNYMAALRRYGEKGVEALAEATPRDTGRTAESWSYTIVKQDEGYAIYWKNSNVQNGANIALLLQYGHATRQGAYVRGIDYINPALKKVFKEMADELWKEVREA